MSWGPSSKNAHGVEGGFLDKISTEGGYLLKAHGYEYCDKQHAQIFKIGDTQINLRFFLIVFISS